MTEIKKHITTWPDSTREDYVWEFHDTFGASVNESRKNLALLKLRLKLLREEVDEVEDEVDNIVNNYRPEERWSKLLKELADVQYVLSGFAVAFGLDLEEAFQRVHISNMSKLGDDGKPIFREDGKILKGSGYKEPDLSDLV